MSIWNPKKPLNQPPHFRSGATPAPAKDAPAVVAAVIALKHARNDRSNRLSAKVAA
jgi:hypothetical protein